MRWTLFQAASARCFGVGLSGSVARSGCGSSSYGWKYSTGCEFSAATSRSARRRTAVGSARQYAPPPIGTERPLTGQTVTGYSQISRPSPSSSRYGVRGTPPIRPRMRGESYWLESYRNPSSASTSYAQGVSRVIEKQKDLT